jgi:acyl-coenzyme A thioesterase PaaI-like protein
MVEASIQERFFAQGHCFGCGPANGKGLRIRSFPTSEHADAEVVCDWTPEKHHEAFENILSGGIVGALLDCHSNWTAAWHLMKRSGAIHPPCTVTADYHVKFLYPTPADGPVKLVARVAEFQTDRAVIEAELVSNGRVCATCRGTFVAVKPGHPAYHRW